MDEVFKALADPTRRALLDRLFTEGGLTQTDLEKDFEMTRFGIAKHLHILEEAGLVTTQRDGRVKRHFLNPVPIHQIHARWIDTYTAHQASILVELKQELEDS